MKGKSGSSIARRRKGREVAVNKIVENNTWHVLDDSTDTVFVFVHGFFSSANSCWRNVRENVFWPDLIVQDSRIPRVSIFLGGYFTDADSHSYGVRECSEELFNALRRTSSSGQVPPLNFKKIVFICHSLGGVVVRYMLECFREYFSEHKIGLVLLASPSIGSDYADRLVKVAAFYKNRTGLQLRKNSELLVDLDSRFKSFIGARPNDSFFGVEGIEHTGFLHCKWLPGFEPIVLDESASRYFSGKVMIPRTNHSTIVKPNDLSHRTHFLLIDFLNNVFFPKVGSPGYKEITSVEVKSGELVAQGPLFDIYESSCEPYYLEREIDKQVSMDFNHSSVWVYGPSGSGKTSLIKRLLSTSKHDAIEMCFSQCTLQDHKNFFITEMIETIHLSENGYETIPERTFSNLSRMIATGINTKKYLFIYIDEVPYVAGDDSAETQLVQLVEDLLTSVKQLTNANSFRIVISSLGRPDVTRSKNPAKLCGYMRVVECAQWTDNDLRCLMDLIISNLNSLEKEELPTDLIKRAFGSPRFLKTFFKTKISQPSKSNDEVLRMSSQGFHF